MLEKEEERPEPLDGPRISVENHLCHVVVIVNCIHDE
jgi:hypothetical protein